MEERPSMQCFHKMAEFARDRLSLKRTVFEDRDVASSSAARIERG
jgi:hypothetical protein